MHHTTPPPHQAAGHFNYTVTGYISTTVHNAEKENLNMNILHMKYAVAVADAGSLRKASEEFLIAQPNLSRSIKELEGDLGITIFDRTARGMTLTPEGEEFITCAKEILKQIDAVEMMYKSKTPIKQRFSISVPRASYISYAFANFSKSIAAAPAEIFYKETNSSRAISNILEADYRLGIIRYAQNFDRYFKNMLEEKGLASELIAEFQYLLLMRKDSPLAGMKTITREDLKKYIEIAHADPYVPSLTFDAVRKEELSGDIDRRIFVFERASQFDLLSENPNTFMWVSPLPDKLLERYGLVMRKCEGNDRTYRDVLIYRSGYRLTALDKQFITELCMAKRQCIK